MMVLLVWPLRKPYNISANVLKQLFTRHTVRTTSWTVILLLLAGSTLPLLLAGSMLINSYFAQEQAPDVDRLQRQIGYKQFTTSVASTRAPMTVDSFAKPRKSTFQKTPNKPSIQESPPKRGTVRKYKQEGVPLKKENVKSGTNTPGAHRQTATADVNSTKRHYRIQWYNIPPYIKYRSDAQFCGFKTCKYSNCMMTFGKKNASYSDAVIFDGKCVLKNVGFTRPKDQIWIFAAHEAPITFKDHGAWWIKRPQWRYGFNWTMTYDQSNTDIYLPYGEILKRTTPDTRDFKQIAKTKTKGALMISSHCPTKSYREKYVKILKKYIDVEILGKCGKPWNCGKHYVHDKCFELLNTTYKYYIAFENAFCRQYFTEKFFENFNFDTIMITRGGKIGEAKRMFPRGTYISTDDFQSIEDLGKYLQKLSHSLDDYANFLKRKSQYYFPGYKKVYQRAMCDLCERLNKREQYRKRIPDIFEWAYQGNPCVKATDLH